MICKHVKGNEAGFTLIEVMVALVLLCLVSISFFSAFTATGKWILKGGTDTVAGNYAHAILENLRSQRGSLLTTDHAGQTSADVLLPGHEYKPDYPDDINAVVDISQQEEPLSHLWNIAVTVTWTENGQTQEFTMHTIIRN